MITASIIGAIIATRRNITEDSHIRHREKLKTRLD
jgi:hypothetical protein